MPESLLHPAAPATELPVPAVLRPWVSALWAVDAREPVRITSVPDGCLDVVVAEHGVQVSGVLTAAAAWDLPAGTRLVGARLRPGAGSLLGISADELPSHWIPLADVLRFDRDHDLVELLARRALAIAPDPRVAEALAMFGRTHGALTVPAVARRVGVSERTLGRLFLSHVGLGPKPYARVVRFQAAMRQVRAGADLTDVAFDAGYANQAHLSREFSALAGVPPSRLRKDGNSP